MNHKDRYVRRLELTIQEQQELLEFAKDFIEHSLDNDTPYSEWKDLHRKYVTACKEWLEEYYERND